jgi:hypothetical protein
MGLLGISCISSRLTPFEAGASAVMELILKRYKIERMAEKTSRSYSTTKEGREYVKKCVLKMSKKAILDTVRISVNWMEKDKVYKTDIPAFVAVGSWDALSMTKKTFAVYRKTMPGQIYIGLWAGRPYCSSICQIRQQSFWNGCF